MILTWRKVPCALFTWRYDLEGIGTENSGCARRTAHQKYLANAYINGHYMAHTASTLQTAMARLNNEIDRRSIGLFNCDTLEFRIR